MRKVAKSTRRSAALVPERMYSERDMELVAQTMSALNETTITKADIDLALDDRGWIRNGSQAASLAEMDMISRRQVIAKARLYWHRDPLAKQAVRLWTDYAINVGCTFQVTEDADDDSSEATQPVGDDNATQAQLESFWNDKRNRKYTSPEGQRKLSKLLLVDGEIFFVILDTADGPVIRRCDPLEITDLVKDPEDSDTVLAYRREAVVNGKTVVTYYKDWSIDDVGEQTLATLKGPNHEDIAPLLRDDAQMYHAAFDAFKDRGNSLLASSVDWLREHRRFMESRVSLLQSLAKFAYKVTAKGGQKAVDKLSAMMQSTFATGIGTGVERNPKPAAGSTWVQNEGADITPMPRSTGGSESKNDGDQIKLMVSAGTGIMLHYFGDPSTGNLATSTAMELPMLKQFEAYQAQWITIWMDIFMMILGEQNEDDMLEPIDISYPPIIKADILEIAQAIKSFTDAFPELKVAPIINMILVALGINNISEVMDQIEQKSKENEAKAAAIAAAGPTALPSGSPPAAPAPVKPPVAAATESEALMLTTAINRMCGLMEVKEGGAA